MANTKEIFARHYDRIIAVVVLALLLFSLLYLVLRGMEVQQSLSDDKASFDPPTTLSNRGKEKLEGEVKAIADKIETSQKNIARTQVQVPKARESENDVQPDDLFTSQARYLCEVCRLPIKMDAKTCTYDTCKKPQTLLAKNEKLDLSNVDSDGDGMMDKWELEYGLNPNSPEDADLDLDDDGISNIDECLAKTNPKDPASHPDYKDYMTLVNLEEKFLLLRVVKTSPGGLGLDENGKSIHLTAVDFALLGDDLKTRRVVTHKPGERIAGTAYRYQTYNAKTSVPREYTTMVQGATSKQTAKMLVNESEVFVTLMSNAALKNCKDYEIAVKELDAAKKAPALMHGDEAAKKAVQALEVKIAQLKEKDAQFAKKERETKDATYKLTFYDEKFYKIEGTKWIGEPLIGLTSDLSVNLLPETLEIKGLSKNDTFEVKGEVYVIIELDETKECAKIKREKDGDVFVLSKK